MITSLIILSLAVAIGNIISHFTIGLLFVLFKANKYEDQLAKKLAKEVKNNGNI